MTDDPPYLLPWKFLSLLRKYKELAEWEELRKEEGEISFKAAQEEDLRLQVLVEGQAAILATGTSLLEHLLTSSMGHYYEYICRIYLWIFVARRQR